ncbi:AAA family ATPase [Staphylococcus hominis]
MFYQRSQPIQTLIIEQPELHLDPALQSQLLEVLLELLYLMNKEYKFSIIIETHK